MCVWWHQWSRWSFRVMIDLVLVVRLLGVIVCRRQLSQSVSERCFELPVYHGWHFSGSQFFLLIDSRENAAYKAGEFVFLRRSWLAHFITTFSFLETSTWSLRLGFIVREGQGDATKKIKISVRLSFHSWIRITKNSQVFFSYCQ